jgi:hypothetical protein
VDRTNMEHRLYVGNLAADVSTDALEGASRNAAP